MLLEVTIKENDANQRVDRYVRKLCPGLSLSRLNYLFRKKEIKIQSKPAARSVMLASGDRLRIYGLKAFEGESSTSRRRNPWKKESFDLPVIFEDESLLVINKPGTVTVHPGSRVGNGKSVIEKVHRHYSPEGDQIFRPSLIHRLDRETSGVLVVAKTGAALRYWTGELRKKKIRKTYETLVIGTPRRTSGTFSGALTRIDSRKGGAKSVVDSEKGRSSETAYKVLKNFGEYTLLQVEIKTGRMHQIRAHLSHAGLPILGDTRYGDFKVNKSARENYGLKRTFLHASQWQGTSPEGNRVLLKAGMPDDLKSCLNSLGSR